MTWLLTILLALCILLAWILLSPVVIEIDTRVLRAQIRWFGIGHAKLWYDDEWQFSFRVLFFGKTVRLADRKAKPSKKKITAGKKKPKNRKTGSARVFKRMVKVLRTFRVEEWKLAIDTGDYTRNAQLYPLNFIPFNRKHLYINFNNRNYLVLKISNRPGRIVLAFLNNLISNK